MSWQAYVDTSLVGTGHVDKAAIFNAEGTSVWATSPGFQVTPAELKEIVAVFASTSAAENLLVKGFHIGGEKYLTLKADDRSIYGKKGKAGAVIVKTKQAILIAHYPETGLGQNAINTVEKLADYLISVGY